MGEKGGKRSGRTTLFFETKSRMDSRRNQRRSFRFQRFKGSEMNQCRTKRSLSGPWAATTIAWTRLNYALIPVWVPSSSNTVELRRLAAFSRFFPPNCTFGGFNFDVSPSLLLPPTSRLSFRFNPAALLSTDENENEARVGWTARKCARNPSWMIVSLSRVSRKNEREKQESV